MKFNEFKLEENILKSLAKINYTDASDVQEKVIPHMLQQENLFVKAKTGSGKTAAYAIPICNQIEWDVFHPQALIITPTRELAIQVGEECKNVSTYKRLKTVILVGKQSYYFQEQDLKQRNHIIVATPGRLRDHLANETVCLDNLKYIVFDEGDVMLQMGFHDDMMDILENIPKSASIQLFSATLAEEETEIMNNYRSNFIRVELQSDNSIHGTIQHLLIEVKNEDKDKALNYTLGKYAINSSIIFANTQVVVQEIYTQLVDYGFCVGMIHGGMEQEDRFENLKSFKNGDIRLLVATNVAARGIDVEDISCIINYEIPFEKENYVHRIGRSGRQEKNGLAISLMANKEKHLVDDIEEFIGSKIERIDFDAATFEKMDKKASERLKDFVKKTDKHQALKDDILKLYIHGGKYQKMRPGDIVGSLCEIDNLSVDDIGIIQIQNGHSYVEILNNKGQYVLDVLQNKPIKGKVRMVEIAK